jgi:hypothetical protein
MQAILLNQNYVFGNPQIRQQVRKTKLIENEDPYTK